MAMYDIEPVVLSLVLTVTKKTDGGLLGGITNVDVLSVNGEHDARFYGFAGKVGNLVLNFKETGRPPKPAKPAPKPLTAAQKAQIPANGTKGKAKAKPAAAPAAAENDAEMQEYLAFKAFQEMKAKAGK